MKRGHLSPPCKNCGSSSSDVVDSRLHEDVKQRSRKCRECGKTFITEEHSVRLKHTTRYRTSPLPPEQPTTY